MRRNRASVRHCERKRRSNPDAVPPFWIASPSARNDGPTTEHAMINYLISMATFAAIYAILALALNVMWGMAGMVNLGIVGFYAFGAYISALLTVKAGAPIALGFAAAMAGTAVMAALTTLGLTRLRDDYLAIVTLGFAEVVRIVAENEIWLTRGTDGISGIPQPLKSLLGADFNLAYLAFCLVLLALVLLVLERVRTAPFGRVLRAIREDAQIAAFAGKDVLKFKVKAFALGGAVAGLAGALYAHYSSYIVPEIYVPLLTIYIFLALTAGGIGNNWGAVVGAFVVVFCLESTRFLIGVIPWLSAEQLAALREFLVGFGLLLVLFFRPRGLMPEPLPRLAGP
jgi:branched-chain amino acid transport system permease protein